MKTSDPGHPIAPPVTDAEVAGLRAQLARLAQKADARWHDSLCERKKEEMAHADQYRAQLTQAAGQQPAASVFGNRKWYAAAWKSQEYMRSWIRKHAPGKVFLDYACGFGKTTLLAAEAGAALAVGLDLSEVGLAAARAEAVRRGLQQNTFFLQGDCEATGLPDQSVDVILCCGMLHHLDLSVALPEMHRVLKPGGQCLAVETFKYNPLIWLYRRLTPSYRTRWEENHIIGFPEIALIKRYLDVESLRYWHFFSLLAVPLRRTPLFALLRAAGDLVDSVILRVFPFSLLAWQVTLEMTKPAQKGRVRRAA